MTNPSWARDPIRAADGRRRLLAKKRLIARDRQVDILNYILEHGISIGARGTQAHLASQFGVAEETIHRDLQSIMELTSTPTDKRCVTWGTYLDVPVAV